MDEIEFTVSGQRIRLTRQQVVEGLTDQVPEPIRTWAVEIEGRRFPVKQVMAVATGLKRTDFTSHRARDVLGRLRFHVANVGGRATTSDLVDLDSRDGGVPRGAGHLNIRLAILQLAVQHVGRRPDAAIPDVLEAAETFEAWLMG